MKKELLNQKVRVSIAGLGNVGYGVLKNIHKNHDIISHRCGARFEIKKVLVRNIEKAKKQELYGVELTTDWRDLIDQEVDVVIELIGGVDVAYDLIVAAIKAKKIVITGNKALLAERGKELFELAEQNEVPILFEAAVAGGIPIIQILQEGLVANKIQSIYGIINGTCNYILTRMSKAGLSYDKALVEAQEKGIAEADPTLDVSGWDAAHKAIILASLSYGFWINSKDVYVEGIDQVSALDFIYAERLGYTIKLLSIVHADEQGKVEVRTEPTLIPKSHLLANVNDSFNAVLVHGDVVGESLFYGRGAGQDPTSSSVISDLCEAAAILIKGLRNAGFVPHGLYGKSKPIEETVSHHYLRLEVDDQPGVLAQVATILAQRGIGVSSVIQPEDLTSVSGSTDLILLIHDATHGKMREAVDELAKLTCIRSQPNWMIVNPLEYKNLA
jgi:homoserine dehydrogenase